LLGMAGADRVQGGGGGDVLRGGDGADYLDGQAGDDAIDGGAGPDVLYGLAGNDRIAGGAGGDYLDGGPGEDVLGGGRDTDVLIGGRGRDRLAGQGGDDRAFTEAGEPVIGAAQTATVSLDTPGRSIQVEGTPEFVARVQSDLDALRSTASGTDMLAALDRASVASRPVAAQLPFVGDAGMAGHTLVIRETAAANGFAGWSTAMLGPVSAHIDYNPAFHHLPEAGQVPPVVVLYHELAHIYDAYCGTVASGVFTGADNPGVPNREREAVGLPIDADADPATPDALHPGHPYPLTENGLREEFGLSPRRRY
ncbi:MAG TPA: M91 family zinc metallopeptidase, partial [Micromonosporaceae bacterium]